MAEITVPDGSWAFDHETLRITPGSGSGVHEIRKVLGELAVPLEAVSSVAFEPGRKGGHLRLRLRPGADPLTDVAAGGLAAPADPYRLAVPKDRTGAAEYFADEVREALRIWQVPPGPCESYLMPGPAVPVSATAGDATVTFDGERIRLEWTWMATSVKEAAGPQEFLLSEVVGVEWTPLAGAGYGSLRFRLKDQRDTKPPTKDLRCVSWGLQKFGGTTALVAAAVHARLTRQAPAALSGPPAPGDQDAVLRRLAELGELHRSGVLTDEEFAAAKQAILRRLG
ncbi:DUF4429 domain-containing protein [Thermoactinospora rubra]|uniref:DUF4429 domain-containing protein n=1 Tax=Thermoactinospora rubra TaxID=1088767 RepID=UPI000A113A05|nr:DUF4429 domain-containing protein [Thermoactinospora rubra]